MPENELLTVSGTVLSVIFYNSDNGYAVIRLRNEDKSSDMPLRTDEPLICVGTMPFPAPGQDITCEGYWVDNINYGHQFSVVSSISLNPDNENAVFEYLSSGVIKGIGPATASLIVNMFGRDSLDVLENRPEELTKIKGITSAKAESFSACFKEITYVRRLMEFLSERHVRTIIAVRLYRYYGESAMKLIQKDPYIIAASHIGGSFAEADSLALSLGFEENSDERICAACLYELTHNLNNGHCFLPYNSLSSAAANLISVDIERVPECIDKLRNDEKIIVDCEYGEENPACYLPELYEAETYIASRLSKMAAAKERSPISQETLIGMIEKENRIVYAEEQRKTIEYALTHRILIITGGPGTGKTTTVKGIISAFDISGIKYLLAAPTGRAAKRMSELSGCEAQTVHRLLCARRSDQLGMTSFGKNESDTLSCDAVIIDEMSMVDMLLMAALLKALPKHAKLICVGDADQLPPVGPGRVFTAMIRSEAFPTVRLTEIFRQAEGSMIVKNAHLINEGISPDFSENKGDFFRLSRDEAVSSSTDTIVSLCASRLPGKMGISSADIQVLSPSRKGNLGTVRLNKELQNAINPAAADKKEKSYGDAVFREGDRVMQIRNNYDILWHNRSFSEQSSGIYNGDIGYIIKIDDPAETMEIDFDGRVAIYPFSCLSELEHAWAITVHKSQGSEFKAVVFALSTYSARLLNRHILYTGITRARDLLILVGKDSVAEMMISDKSIPNRFTHLRRRLMTDSGAAG